MEEDKKVAMVVAAHPDDTEFGVGGTLVKWARDGWHIIDVVCTNGDKGSSDPEMTPERLAKIREREQKEAAEILGVAEVIFLGNPDGGLEDTSVFRGDIVRIIRKYRPDAILTHDPHRKYMNHRDHRIAGQVTLDAIYPYARDNLFYPEHRAEGLQPHKVKEVYLWGSDDPDTFVDISEVFEIKMKAVSRHVSQVGDHSEDWEAWLQQRRERAFPMGRQQGSPMVEAFHKIEIRR